ncbi:hypothetical protein AAL_00190 [Moelleriella libera RCEF 2490]|uniref:Uncharacterized protein n=1 Tax=Moelleriella libera RCEF 2490 TaxID=1081109 RepID=A0A166RMH3_9HYPO|nr:hypothetical protein AAL_00190 [Moelleriella libera RCEF 2490]
MDLAEFYVACHPALSVTGVSGVIERVQELPVKVIEILYETDAQWFKLITPSQIKDDSARAVEQILRSSMPFDEVRETPAFWNDLPEPQSNIYEEQFHDFEGQFPSTMRGLPHKAIWTGLLSGHGFAAFEPLLKSGFVTSSLVPFLVEKLGCEVSSNLGGTIVYLATNVSQAVIDAAIETLENLLSLASRMADNVFHFIHSGKDRLSFRYLSHLGLSRSTYGTPHHVQAAVSIRAASKVGMKWVSDETVYHCHDMIKVDEGFRGFRDNPTDSRPSPRLGQTRSAVSSTSSGSQVFSLFDIAAAVDQVSLTDTESMYACPTSETRSLLDDDLHFLAEIDKKRKTKTAFVRMQPEGKTSASIKDQLASMCSVLTVLPGHVQVKLHFGRICVPNLDSSRVDLGNGPHWKKSDLLQGLHDTQPEMIFSSILTVLGQEADIIAGTNLPQHKRAWVPTSNNSTFQMECSYKEQSFTVLVDVEDLSFKCRSSRREVGCTYIHCPEHAWDMKVTVDQADLLDQSEFHAALGRDIVNSLQRFQTAERVEVPHFVTSLCRMQVADFSHAVIPDSVLSVSRVQKFVCANPRGSGTRPWCASKRQKDRCPGSYYTADIQSAKLNESLEANSTLALGGQIKAEDGTWSGDLLKSALTVISVLNDVGNYNDNSERANLTFRDGSAEARKREESYVFW